MSRSHGSTPRGVEVAPIRVLHVINQLDQRAGAEVSLLENVLGSQGTACDHGIVLLSGTLRGTEPLATAGVQLFRAPEKEVGRIGLIQHVTRAIEAFGPDLVHTSLFEADLAGRLAAARTRLPVLTSIVNTPYIRGAVRAEVVAPWKISAVKWVDRFLARFATSAFHAISDATAAHAVEHLAVDPVNIRTVPRGRRSSELGERTAERRQRVRQQMGWGDRPVLINVARQEPQKGHRFMLEALPAVQNQHPDVLLVLVGRRGRSTPAIDLAIEAHGLEGAVQVLLERTDVPDLLAAADLFVFSSLYEGLGGAVIEAAGIGLPVVAFDVPAVREILGPEHPWLTPIADTAALGDAIGQALGRDRSAAEHVGRRQQQRFRARYESEVVAADMMRLYSDIVHLARRRTRSRSRARRLPVGCRGSGE